MEPLVLLAKAIISYLLKMAVLALAVVQLEHTRIQLHRDANYVPLLVFPAKILLTVMLVRLITSIKIQEYVILIPNALITHTLILIIDFVLLVFSLVLHVLTLKDHCALHVNQISFLRQTKNVFLEINVPLEHIPITI